jgi:serine phosphatase RsbU (regulator of sigma subunit)/tetratricopeptide (TPR) repeat protein
MLYFKYFISVITVLSFCFTAEAQESFLIDSLKKEAGNAPAEKKAAYFNEMSRLLRNSKPQQAIEFGKQAIGLAETVNDFEELAKAYSFTGVAFRNSGDFEQALAHYSLGLELAQKHELTRQEGYAHINFANAFIYTNETQQALEHLETADSIAAVLPDTAMLAYSKLNKGRVYIVLNMPDSARKQINRAIKLRTLLNDESGLAVCYKYLGDLELTEDKMDAALESYKKALDAAVGKFDIDLLSALHTGMASIYLQKNQLVLAQKSAELALEYAIITNNPVRIRAAYLNMATVFKENNLTEKALEYSELARQYTDSMYARQLSEKVTNVIYVKKLDESRAVIENLEKDAKLKQAELNNQHMRLWLVLLFALLILALLLGIYIFYRQKKKAYNTERNKNKLISAQNNSLHQSNEEIKTQRDEIEKQKFAIERQQKQIHDSILYAERIQNATLPKKELIDKMVPYNFILFIPRDIVSGDFYFFKKIKQYLIISAADCTGHGIPGAFVSMLGISLLNEITENKKIVSPDTMLEELRKNIKYSLGQSSDTESQDDGMDMSLAVINTETLELEYAGANNPIYIIRNNELTELKPNLNPIGIYFREKPFQKEKFQLKKDDSIYLFSDGYADQFGGENNRRFMGSELKKLLISLQKYPMSIQRNLLKQHFYTWKGTYKQIDDVLLMGIKITNLLNKE